MQEKKLLNTKAEDVFTISGFFNREYHNRSENSKFSLMMDIIENFRAFKKDLIAKGSLIITAIDCDSAEAHTLKARFYGHCFSGKA